jgi:hypothetical protein
MPVKIFFCYAHEDEAFLNKLKAHLSPLQRQGFIAIWHDRDISAGVEWEQEIKEQLNAAQIILLLISPDFMNSDYCYGIEMQRAIERHERKEARVIPVILDYVYWKVEPLRKLQALPTDTNPITSASWRSQNEAFLDVVEGVRKAAMEIEKQLLKVAQVKLVIKALEKSKYQKGMRTIKGVSIDTGLSPEEVQEIINELGEQVIKSGKWVKLNRPG